MPIYEFKCKQCDKIFDEFILNSNNLSTIYCPQCNSKDVSKMMSTFGFSSNSTSLNSNTSCSSCGTKNCATCK